MTASTFPTARIALTAAIVGAIALPLSRWVLGARTWRTVAVIALVVALANFGWRLCANMPQLNNDGAPGFSANDLAAPMFGYVVMGVLANVWPPSDVARYGRLRALLAAVALAVNVITI